ncbi:MAG TPA: 50S ribosomal protein L3 [Candidatus Margulisiibacteriota bacterium]|nr:50S ribosomal protein L3 [Candidatus Margulisiibacteriota bacterium]
MLGLIGKKVGMTQVFNPAGELIPVTVIQAGPCIVVQTKTVASDGYVALQLGFGEQKPQRRAKAYRNHCTKAGKGVFAVLAEFVPPEGATYAAGQEIKIDEVFKAGDRIDVSGTTKGRGYAGVIKRHGFGGFPGSHGTHEYFRHGGSIGNRSFPGRVFKGKRMAGQYGNDRVTTQNLEVIAVRPAEHVMLVRGCVPGARNGVVFIRPAVKGIARV